MRIPANPSELIAERVGIRRNAEDRRRAIARAVIADYLAGGFYIRAALAAAEARQLQPID